MIPPASEERVPIVNATAGKQDDRGQDFLAIPTPPSGEVDPEVYKAWKQHIINGFQQNNEMFKKVLDAFMRPYWLTVNMYRILFAVGIAGFVVAVILGVFRGPEFALVFGGLSVTAFLAFFISQPLRALERNIHFITWLGVIYNTYWTRLMYANDKDRIQDDLDSIARTAVDEINQLIDKHANLAGKSEPPPQ
jgi:hypothetical protein